MDDRQTTTSPTFGGNLVEGIAPVDASAVLAAEAEQTGQQTGERTAPAQPAQPAWLEGADHEELAELAQLGVVATPELAAEHERDALVSQLLRAAHEHETDAQRFVQAELREHAAIRSRYERLSAPAMRQLARLNAYIKHVAASATFTGRKKSRDVGWGSYGVRKDKDAVAVTDEPAMLAWLEEHRPDVLMIDVSLSLANAKRFLADDEVLGEFMDDPVVMVLRAAVAAKEFGYSKKALTAVVVENLAADPPVEIPGATHTVGTDQPWYKVEVPPDYTMIDNQGANHGG